MAENKLLGTQQLNTQGVLNSIQEVNIALQNLGKGVDLDLTKVINSKVSGELANLKKQIEEVHRAATGQTKAHQDMIKQAAQLRVDQLKALQDLEKQKTPGAEWDRLQTKVTQTSKAYNEFTSQFTQEAKQQVLETQKVVQAQEKLDSLVNKTRDTAYKKNEETQTKIALNALEQRTAAVRKAAQEEQKAVQEKKAQWEKEIQDFKKNTDETIKLIEQKRAAQEKADQAERDQDAKWRKDRWAEDIKNFKKNTDETIALIEKKRAAQQKADSEQVKSVAQVYKEQLEIEKKLASGTAGKNETAVLQKQLAEKQAAFASYGKSIQEAAKADASVVKAQQDLALTQAQAQDKILKEQQKAQEEAAKAAEENAKRMQDYQKQWTNTLVSMAGAASIAILKKQWAEAINYATEYYDRLNEIRVVTGKTEKESAKIGQDMRNLAKEMKVTSTELSKAAVTFYRQGLSDAEVQDRLKWVTEYAKIANIEFDDAAQLMTASINTMGDSIEQSGFANVVEHIADVWLYLGDNAATSGEEIGKAMQKASASATEFGLSFEWLGTYIATVSEQTRQAPESIGNAFNTMLARMHQIKSSGFNDEDTTKLNDVAKALKTIDVELLDSKGQWRDMDKIYSDIAEKWGELDAKTKGYLATTMAGTRQQNVFYALMNDLSKGIEGGSRAQELYSGAMESAGTATQKFSIWQESVEASQSNMTNSFEQLYSNLKPDLIKGFYDMIALLVTGLNNLGGVIPVVIAGIVALATTIKMATTMTNPLVSLMTGAAAAVAALIAMGGIGSIFGGGNQENYEKATENYTNAMQKIQQYSSLQNQISTVFGSFKDGTSQSAEQVKSLNTLLDQLSTVSPTAKKAVDDLRGGLITLEEAAGILNGELENLIASEQLLSQLSAAQALRTWSPSISGTAISSKQDFDVLSKYGYSGTTESLQSSLESFMDSYLRMTMDEIVDAMYAWDGKQLVQTAFGHMVESILEAAELSGYSGDFYGLAENYSEYGGYVWSYLYQLILGDDKQYAELQKKAEQEAENVIDLALRVIGDTIGSGDKTALKTKMKEFIAGENGIIDPEDFVDGDAIRSGLQNIINTWIEEGSKSLDNMSRLRGIFDTVFKDGALKESYIQSFESEMQSIAESDELTNAVMETFAQLISAGLSPESIARVLEQTFSLFDWADMSFFSVLSQYLADSVFGFEDPLNFTELFTKVVGQNLIELDTETLAMMVNLSTSGKTLKEFLDIFNDPEVKSQDDFKNKLQEISDAVDKTNESMGGEGGQENTVDTYVKNIAKASTLIDKIKSLQEAITNGESPKLSDFMDVAEVNPEIIALSNNLGKLKEKLDEIQQTAREAEIENLIGMMRNSEEAFANSKYAQFGSANGITTFSQLEEYYTAQYGENSLQVRGVGDNLRYLAERFLGLAEAGEQTKEVLTGIDKVLKDLQDADKLTDAFKVLQDMENYDGTKAAEALKTIKDILGLEDLKKGEDIGTWLENAQTKADEFTESANQAAQAYGILTEEEIKSAQAAEEARKAREDYINSMKDLSQSIADEIEANKASANGYANQIAALQAALSRGDVQAAAKQWKGFNDTIKSGMQKTYPQLAKVLADISAQEGSAAKNTQNLTKEQKNAEKVASAKYFKDSAKALYDVGAGTKTATEALSTFHSEEEKVIEAQLEYIDVSQKFAEKTEVTKSDVSALAEVLGWTPQAILDNWDMIAPMMDDIQKSMEDLRAQFQEALWLNIVGSSDVDFSDVLNGLVAVQDTADAAVQALLATGEFEIEEKDLEEGMNYFAVDSLFPFRGHWETASAKSTVQVLKPKGSPGLQKTGGGSGGGKSGGGGGGGGNKNEESEVTKMMNRMQEIYDLQKHTIDLYAAQANYFSETGQLQGVIKYYEKERKAVQDQNKIIEEQMAEMEPYLKQKEKEIKALDEASDEYKTCKSDLEKLQKQHQSYALELVNNKTKVEQLTKAIQEQQDAIRQLEIDIENELLQAIEDREGLAQSKLQARIKLENEVYRVLQQQEEKQKRMLQGRINLENEIYRIIEEREALRERMLQGRIEMENTILDLLKQNAEEERDSILENTQSLIDALQKERDLLSEQLQLRKELAQEQDKQAKLAELEEKYSRISADPTRQKEALSIRKQIDDLRDEMGWDRAEKEVKARQEDIDDQIAALNKHIKEVQAYYDQLFKNPEEQIAQMQEILQKSDDEIIKWLKANDSSYATSTAATKKNMVNTWKSSLRDMHGQTVTYWDEVSKVIKGTDDEIINWMIANDQTYQNSSAETRQSLLNGWQDMLSDMRGYNEDLWGQVEQIMEQYSDNITEWLEQNDEEYANKTKAQQEDIRNNWAQMLREMKGDIVTYWDEVHSIMEQGDDAIINFLKANSAKYREASSAQASAYVDGWMQKLADLKSALASVTSDLIPVTTYSTTSGGSSSGSSSSGGGGGGDGGGGLGGSTSSESSMQQAAVNMIYKSIGENKILAQSSNNCTPPTFSISGFIRSFSGYTYHHSEPSGTFMDISPGGSYSVTYWYSKNLTQSTDTSSTDSSLPQTASSVKPDLPPLPQATAVDLQDNLASSSKSTVTFDTGGVPANEGQAYVHAKERILNPYQTELFESLVNAMDVMSRIMVPDMPDFNQSSLQNNSSVSIGDIIVNVDKMDTDADYEEMAERVLDAIMEKLNRGSVVGGIRFSR